MMAEWMHESPQSLGRRRAKNKIEYIYEPVLYYLTDSKKRYDFVTLLYESHMNRMKYNAGTDCDEGIAAYTEVICEWAQDKIKEYELGKTIV